MTWLRVLVSRLIGLLQKSRLDWELDEELRSHLDMLVEENLREGMSPKEARYAARRSFGGVEQAKEIYRDRRGLPMIETLVQDLRYGLRMQARNPTFTAVIVLTLAVGIGANTAIFSVVNAVLLRPLPYKDPDRLVEVWNKATKAGYDRLNLSAPEFIDYRNESQIFEELAAVRPEIFNLGDVDDPEQIIGQCVSGNFFNLLGVAPVLGRSFLAEEDQFGKDHVIILSYGLWQRRFGGEPSVVGRTVKLNGESYGVVGVMPHAFRYPPFSQGPEIWKPIAFSPQESNGEDKVARMTHGLSALARLRPGTSVALARAEMRRLAQRLVERYPHMYGPDLGWGATVEPVHESLVGEVRLALLVLLGAVGFVLLIGCVNVASLLLARATERQREMAIRTALGAGRFRLIRQLLTESLLLSLLGGVLGLLMTRWSMQAFVATIPGNIPRRYEIDIDGGVLGFTLLISVLTGVLFGLVPALGSMNLKLPASLKEGGRTGSVGSQRKRVLSILVASEIALALVLLSGAGLLMKSLYRLYQVNPGFEAKNVLTMWISLPESKYREAHEKVEFSRSVLERVVSLPGVRSAGTVTNLPMAGSGSSGGITAEDLLSQPERAWREVAVRMVAGDYFGAMNISLLKGRYFTQRDSSQAPGVAIVDEALAHRFWLHEDPIGKRVHLGPPDYKTPWLTIIGIVRHVKNRLDTESREQFYMPHQQGEPHWMNLVGQRMYLVIRTATEPMSLAAAVKREIWTVDKDQPVSYVQSMEGVVSQTLDAQRFNLFVLGTFAALALLLAAAGIYGVMAYAVRQRIHEIGIRMALGAQRKDVLRLILKRGLAVALIGLGLGLGGSAALTRLISSQLYEVSPTDPVILLAVSMLLVAAALLASYIPARRATKVDPMAALRYE